MTTSDKPEQPPPTEQEPFAPLGPSELRHTDVLIATVGGSGFLRPAPGTWGSAVALPAWALLIAPLSLWAQLAIVLVTFAIGVWVSERVCRRYGVKDHPSIVIDEVAGQWLALLALPADIVVIVLAFALFRLLDIRKPGPIGWLDARLPGGFGVMTDDLAAGAIVAAVLHVALALLPAGYAIS